jgi:hypothetical protein
MERRRRKRRRKRRRRRRFIDVRSIKLNIKGGTP